MTEGVKKPVIVGVVKYPSMKVACAKIGINYNTFVARKRTGMSDAKALQGKVRKKAPAGTGPKALAKAAAASVAAE